MLRANAAKFKTLIVLASLLNFESKNSIFKILIRKNRFIIEFHLYHV